MLKVLCGRFREDLEEALLKFLEGVKSPSSIPSVLIIATTSRLLGRLKMLVARRFGVFLGIHFIDIYHLAEKILQDKYPYRLADEFFLKEMVLRLVEKNKDSLPYLGRTIRSYSWAASLYQALRDLKDADVDPEKALEALEEGFGRKDKEGLEGVKDLFLLYRLYQSELERLGRVDPSDLLKIAATSAQNSKFLSSFEEIIFYGFYDLTQLQYDLLESITKNYPTMLFYPRIKDDPTFRFQDRFFNEYIKKTAEEILYLCRLEETSLPQLRLFSASGKKDEIWMCAKEILKLLDEGYMPEEIALCARNIEEYIPIVEEIFHENKIPFLRSAKDFLIKKAISKATSLLIQLREDDYQRRSMTELFNSGFFGQTMMGFNLEILSRSLGILKGKEEWLSKISPYLQDGFRYSTAKEDEEPSLHFIPAREIQELYELLERLVNRLESIPEEGSWGLFSQEYLGLFIEFIKPLDEIHYQKIKEIIIALSELDEIESSISRKRFVEALLERIKTTKIEPGQGNIRGVNILDAMSARGLSFKVIFLVGMNKSIFPRFIIEEPFIKDRVRSDIIHVLGNKISLKKDGHDEERLLFRLLVLSAQEGLYLFYERADDQGRVQSPSIYLGDFYELDSLGAPGGPARWIPRRMVDRLSQLPMELLTPQEAFFLLAYCGDQDALRFLKTPLTPPERPSQKGLTKFDGKTGHLEDFWEDTKLKGFSPTALERYTSCPFRYFAYDVLRLSPAPVPEEGLILSNLQLGILYHKVLLRFYTRWKDKKDPENILALVCGEVFEEFRKENQLPYPLLWEKEKERIKKLLEEFIRFDLENMNDYTPIFFEKEIRTPIDGIPVNFHGKIDRIDRDKNGMLRIIDYKKKRGSSEGELVKLLLRGKRLQSMLYLFMLEELFPGRVQRMDFYFIEDITSKGLSSSVLKERKDHFLGMLSALLDSIKEGLFFALPRKYTTCRACEFLLACKKWYHPSLKRAKEDPSIMKLYMLYEAEKGK